MGLKAYFILQIRIFKQSLHFLYSTFTMNVYLLVNEKVTGPKICGLWTFVQTSIMLNEV